VDAVSEAGRDNVDARGQALNPSKGWLIVDIETDGEPWDGKLVAIGVCDPETMDATCYFGEVPTWLREAIADPEVGIVEHTLYDARWLELSGHAYFSGPIADTRVMAWNVDENTPLDLESLAFRYCAIEMDKRIKRIGGVPKFKTDAGEYVRISEAPQDELARYLTGDLVATARLFNALNNNILQPELWEQQVELTSVLLGAETAGLPVDEKKLEDLHIKYCEEREYLREALVEELPPAFNLNSDDQVAALLYFEEFQLPARYRIGEAPEDFVPEKEGRIYVRGHHVVQGFGLQTHGWTDSAKRPKVDAKTLAVHHGTHPWVADYLAYAKVDKVIGTYLESFPRFMREGRLYGLFNQAGTVTGRLSSSSPNLQNIPARGDLGAEVRSLVAGRLIVADFSQLEPRLMAHWSKDPVLTEVYTEGLDIYKQLAVAVFGTRYEDVTTKERTICKTLILGMSYGAKGRTIAEQLSIGGYPTSPKTATGYLRALEDRFARFFEWRQDTIAEARVNGFVRTIGGRKRNLTFTDADSWRVERQAVNSVIQGSAADIVNATMVLVADIPDVSILSQVHDELVMEWHNEPHLEEIQRAGEQGHGYVLNVPLVFEPKVVQNWGEK
jgi:DNA polymerase-1